MSSLRVMREGGKEEKGQEGPTLRERWVRRGGKGMFAELLSELPPKVRWVRKAKSAKLGRV